ncbi:MAG TPA: response regulator [Candidatus Acidoferrales bacterium]|nr:response regulator [Candidatus Acidoferrales bacterium]
MSPVRVLIVDDHEITRRAIRSFLIPYPEWQICGEAIDGIDAVEKANSLRPCIILMDISMPRMNGLEATKVIKQKNPESKIIIVSQNDPSIVSVQAREAGAVAYVTKKDIGQDLVPTLRKLADVSPAPAESKAETSEVPPPRTNWVAGEGEMARLIREKDWSKTPLGALESWPQSLRIAVNLMLNSRQPMWVGWGREMFFLYNDAYISILGLAKHPNALARRASEIWEEIWDFCGPLTAKVFEKGEATFVDDVQLFMNRGDLLEENFYSFSYNPIFDEAGEISGLFCPNTDTTPKTLNARRLRTLSELTAKSLVERSTDAACASSFATIAKNPDDIPFALLYLLDAEGNRAFLEQTTGISLDLEKLSPPQIDLEKNSRESEFWHLNRMLSHGLPEIISLDELSTVPAGLAGQPLKQAIILPVTSGRQDRPIAILIAGVNPTRRLDSEYHTFYGLLATQVATVIQNARAAEEDRKRAESLAELDRAKTVFFSNVSHEFRTPLTLMLGPVEDLLSRSHTDLSPSAKNQLELVSRNGSRLLRLVNTLLDFSRIEAGRMQVVYQPTDLSAFTLELASVFRSATEKAGLLLELDCRTLDEPVYVDRDMWEKIVLNLISNAFKFTFDGTIAVSLEQTGNTAELRVRDTGIGVPANEVPRLFDRFHRVQNARSRTHEGSGIGLALVQELVKLHSGFVRVESSPGNGSTFIVSIPLGRGHLPQDRIGLARSLASTAVGATPFVEEAMGWLPVSNPGAAQSEPPIGRELLQVPCPPVSGNGDAFAARHHVLIADDNADMRDYLYRLLAERYEVKAVANGQAALEAVGRRTPDLILSDVMMPELDGFGLLHKLRSEPKTKTIPVILLSARAGEESRVEGMEHGADDYLIKPFSARELLARVQTHLEMARIRKLSEESLRRQTEQFETLLNEAPLGVYLIDSQLKIRAANPTADHVFGNIPDIIGKDFEEVLRKLWPKQYAEEILERFRHTLTTGEPYLVSEHIENRLDLGVREVYEWQISCIPIPEEEDGVVCYFRDISRQVHAREAIVASEARLRLASEAAELGIWHWYPGQDQVWWENDRPYEIFGRDRDEGPIYLSEFRENIIHFEDGPKLDRAISEMLDKGARLFFQGRIHRKDGSIAWIELSGQLEHSEDGTPWRVLGAVLDITQRKQSEVQLRQQRERMDLVAAAADVGFWFCDLPFDHLIWDNRVKEHFWLTPETDVTIDMFYDRLHPDDRERTRQAIAASISNQLPYDIEYRTVSEDGQEKWIRAIGRTFYDSEMRPKSFDGLTLDITESKRDEERERRITTETIAATAKFRAVFEQSSVFAAIMTLDGKVIDANRLCLEMCGYRLEDVLGHYFWDTGWWRNSKEAQKKIRAGAERAARGIPYTDTLIYHWADGTERLVDFGLYPILDPEGKVIFLHPTGIDITERARAAEELRNSEEKLRTLAEELETQVRARTRELEQRNAEVLQQSEQLSELSRRLLQAQDQERRHIARELHDSAGQIVTVLSMQLAKIGDFAKLNPSQAKKDMEDCQHLVRQLSQEIRTTSYLLYPPLLDETGLNQALSWYIEGLSQRSGLEVHLGIPAGFGRLPRDMELIVYRLVQECLTNIHRHSGSKSAQIRIRRERDKLSLEIQDAGKGISPEKMSLLQSQRGGVGIRGMRERIRQFHGTMQITSNPSGTTISFEFPIPLKGDSAAGTIGNHIQTSS